MSHRVYAENGVMRKLLVHQIKSLNRGLAKQRSMDRILKEEEPYTVTNDGGKHFFDLREVGKLKGMIPRYRYNELKLPIFLYVDMEVPDQYYVRGRLESNVIKKLCSLGEGYGVREGKLWIPKVVGRKVSRENPSIVQLFYLL